jgi:outer membrane protein assembly factor BamD (BamD/ComL family)
MSVSAIGSCSNMSQMSSAQDRKAQWQSQLQQVGNDLQSGNLTQAQTDFSSLVQGTGKGHHHHHHHAGQAQASSSSATDQQTDPIAQAFSSLSQALKSGDLSAAQQALATIQQDLQQGAAASVAGAASSSVAQPTGNLINVTG